MLVMLLMGGWVFWIELFSHQSPALARLKEISPGVAIVLIIAFVKLVALETRIADSQKASNQAPAAKGPDRP